MQHAINTLRSKLAELYQIQAPTDGDIQAITSHEAAIQKLKPAEALGFATSIPPSRPRTN